MQSNFPSLLSVDWLQMFVTLPTVIPYIKFGKFRTQKREYGSKLWREIYTVSYDSTDGIAVPFATLCAVPTSPKMQQSAGSLKLDNAILYNSNWRELLNDFLITTGIMVTNLSRVDLALDFLFLKNRVSGPQLVKNLLNYQWWKCGRSAFSLNAYMPYSIKWARRADDMNITEMEQNDGKISSRVQTLTFGKISSAAQVCIYDKTAELRETEIDGISKKEYIRDCHKLANVYDEKRHTWRVEIRLTSKAATIYEPQKDSYRPLLLSDLSTQNIWNTFRAAADVWFRLVERPEKDNGSKTLHKNRLKVVELFDAAPAPIKFKHEQKTTKPSRFYKAMAGRCLSLYKDITTQNIMPASRYDAPILLHAGRALVAIANDAKRLEQSPTRYDITTGELIGTRYDSDRDMELSLDCQFQELLKKINPAEQFMLQRVDENNARELKAEYICANDTSRETRHKYKKAYAPY